MSLHGKRPTKRTRSTLPFDTSVAQRSALSKRGKTAIPWEAPVTPETAAYAAIGELCTRFEECPMMQMAFDTLCGEILRAPLEWVDPNGKALPDIDVSCDMDLAIIAAIKAMFVAGVFFWKRDPASDTPHVAHPTQMWYGKRGWTSSVLCEPFPPTFQFDQVNSPVARAFKPSLMLAEHERLLLNRDRLNSRPSVFVTVDSRIQNNNGQGRPWFRQVGRDFIDSISEEMTEQNRSLDNLVKDRADVIGSLGESTLEERMRINKGSATEDDAELDAECKYHREHVVRDGYEAKPASSLQSLVDGQKQIEKLENRVLYAMNIPPVALGRNVNSERMASAPQLVMVSLRSYHSLVKRVRRLISEMLEETTKDSETGNYVHFAKYIDNYDLDRLESILTPEAASCAYSATFGIPQEWISSEAVKMRQGALHSGQNTAKAQLNAERQVKRSRGPPPKSTEKA